MKLEYETVTIEMENETQVQGIIMGIDPATATFTLENAKMIIKDREPIRLKALIIRGNYINYCILAENLPLDRLLLQEDTTEKAPFRGRGKYKGWKHNLKKRNKQTLDCMSNYNPDNV